MNLRARSVTLLILPVVMLLLAHNSLSKMPVSQGTKVSNDSKRLAHLEQVFNHMPQFGVQFWRESKKVADEAGPRLIHAVMNRSGGWHGEEGLVFVPVIALLPRKPAARLLREYSHSSEKSKRIWAREYLEEIDAPDVKSTVEKIRGKG